MVASTVGIGGSTAPQFELVPSGRAMTYGEILEYLSYAAGHELQVRITLRDGTEVVGIPSSIDVHPAAHEVYLRPLGVEDLEMGLSLGQIVAVELL